MRHARNITLRQANSPENFAAARQLFEEYAAWLGFSLAYQNFDDELACLPGKYAGPTGRLLLARVGDALAGCVAMRPLEPGICEMKRLYVRPEFRAHGLGRRLAEHLISEARSIGYSRMRLDTIPEKMAEAVHLYTALGFYEIPAYYQNARPGTLYFELPLNR
jgi:ribosomal protein S18 acetylase RimI-like enzyme